MHQPPKSSSSQQRPLWIKYALPAGICLLFHLIAYAQPAPPPVASFAVPDHRYVVTASGFPVFRLEAVAYTPASTKFTVGEAVITGAAIGCLLGGVAGYAITPREEAYLFSDDWNKVLNGLAGAAIGAGVGALAGLIAWKLSQRGPEYIADPYY